MDTEKLDRLIATAQQRPLTAQELAVLNDAPVGFDAAIALRYTHVANGEVRAQLRVGPSHLQPWGIVNGGVYCAMAESTGSLAGVIAAKKPVAGVNNSTDFIKGVSGGVIQAIARPIQLGGRTQLWSVEMFNNDALVARTTLRTFVL